MRCARASRARSRSRPQPRPACVVRQRRKSRRADGRQLHVISPMGMAPHGSPLEGSVAFTGRLASMKRATAFEHVRRHGGTPRRGVTKTTSLLVVGELGWPLLGDGRPSNSLARAKTYGVAVASERRFLELTGEA